MNKPKKTQREPKDFIADLKFFRSNKISIDQSVAFFAGLSYELILNTKIFPRNSDLKPFINEVYLTHDTTDKEFREYLYASRTLLGARLTRNILDNFDYLIVKEISKDIEYILLENFMDDEKNNKNTHKKDNDFSKNIASWLGAISKTNEDYTAENNE